MIPIEEARNFLNKVHLELSLDNLKNENIEEIAEICLKHKGEALLVLHFVSEKGVEHEMLCKNAKVENSTMLLEKLTELPYINSIRLSQ